ncbi:MULTISPECIES: TetR/AcrR family transcriptional regulator [unclassified Nocardia]|uniref:TetR/AcrR family transcriptional regulator n=1 Tax=unclassified Nocardia TaxID=2637762 RepID=UPI0033BC4B0F
MSGDSATVRRGRPPQTREQADEVRARIVEATAAVFARNGSRGLSVAQIIEQAGLARPTFYRYFGNAAEPLHVVLTASNDGLVGAIRDALSGTDEPVQLGIRLIDAFIDWARGHGPMLRPLFAELHDPASLVSAYRERALDDIRALVRKTFVELGRPVPTPLDMDTALHVCEYVVYRLTMGTEPGSDPDPVLDSEARITMIRVLLVTLGTRDDLAYAMELPGLFPEP